MRLARPVFAAFLAAALSFALPAATHAAAKPPVATQPTSATPPLFKVTDADSEFTILGTFHILPQGLDWRSREAGAAIDQADVLWFEAEVDTQAARQQTLQMLMTKGFLPAGKSLSAMLGADDAAKLASVAEGLKLPMSAIDTMRPWQAFLTLSVQFIINKGFDPASGVETVLLSEARARGRPLRFLESVEQQLGLFSSLRPDVEKALLALTLREWETQEAEFDQLFEAWRTGDVEKVNAIMNEPMRDSTPEVYEILVARRNEAWAEEIGRAIAGGRGKAVVAVGAAHLAGERSLPALLAAKGFTVARIEPAPPKK